MVPTSDGLSFGVMSGGAASDVEYLESLPIASLWVGGHVASPNPSPEAMVALAWLAARTTRVRVGTAILLLPLYPPAVVAKQIADLDRATGGRITLGVGVGGEYPSEFAACGVPIGERGPRTDDAIPLLRALWSGEPVSHHGQFVTFDDVRIHPPPLQGSGLPIVVAGRQPAAMRRAARLGDGWMPYLYSPRRYAESVTVIRETAAAGGRDLSAFEWFAFVFVNLDDDGDQAREHAAQFLGGTYTKGDFAAMVDRVAAAGTVDQVTTTLQAFVDAGARHLIFTPMVRGNPRPLLDRLVGEVLPRLHVAAA
ncbi:MAG TPA: TIGR03619 family F420-dependent LLM class oxidoreductase [Acidimicrobiia bacterium]|nr:TIGR03619 family F420-dependent LLM class oxidoreductase [Acidimicrobiia bacterium]